MLQPRPADFFAAAVVVAPETDFSIAAVAAAVAAAVVAAVSNLRLPSDYSELEFDFAGFAVAWGFVACLYSAESLAAAMSTNYEAGTLFALAVTAKSKKSLCIPYSDF